MQGMAYAYNLAKEQGLDALKKEMDKRNFLRIPLNIPMKKVDEFVETIKVNLYNNILTVVLYTLHDKYGFAEKRLSDFKKAFDYNVQCTMDLDYMGEHYVKMEDYAAELNKKFRVGIDIEKVAATQDAFDEQDERYHTCKVDRVVELLRENGFQEAAVFIEGRLD